MPSLIAKDVQLKYNVKAKIGARPATRTATHLVWITVIVSRVSEPMRGRLNHHITMRVDRVMMIVIHTHLPEGAAHGDSFSSQAARGSSCKGTASSLSSVDQTAHFLIAARNSRRPHQKQTRAHRRKCPLTTTTYHPQTAGETATMYEDGSSPPRVLSQDDSCL